MSTVKERLIEFISHIELSQSKFEKSIGLSNGYVNNIRKSISPEVLNKILLKHKNLNKNWLIFNEGEMLINQPVSDKILESYYGDKSYQQQRLEKKLQPKRKEIPFYDADVEAGALIETEMTPIHAPAGTIDVGDLLNDSESALRVYGNSMIPNYPPGCVVGLIKYNESFIEPGEIYVIETAKFRRVKRLFYKDDNPDSDTLVCISDNILTFKGGARDGKLAYPPFHVKKDEIINLFAVSGVIKRNINSVIINR